MEFNFSTACRQLANAVNELADEYDKEQAIIKSRIDNLEYEVAHNNTTKREILRILQEDLNGI